MFGGEIVFGGFFGLTMLAFGGIVALMIWLGIRAKKAEDARRAALAAMVTGKGYSYLADYPERTGLFASSPFGLGDSRKALDVVWGSVGGRPFETFAYRYETHTTDSKGNRHTEVHKFQVTWIPLPAPIATMRMTADNAFLRMFAKMGAKDLEVESHEFNQRWKVWCADERIGHAVLTPALIAYLLAPGWIGRGIVIESRLLMTYSSGHSNLHDLEGVVGGLYGFLDQMPGFLREPGS